jgi:L-iditol 2-dehydrogenase
MKALVLEEYKKFVYRDVPTPVPGDGEVLVRVKVCAVCGSDVHGMDGSTGRRQPPIIMGHEAAGVIESAGMGVRDFKAGDRVTFDSTIYCNHCDMCKAGHVNLCASRRVLGVSCEDYRLNGAFAEYVAVPEYVLYRLPDSVSYLQAAMVEPLAIAYHAATRTPVTPGACAVILGVGTIGMLTLQVVRAMGAETVIAVDIDDEKLATALAKGATAVVNSKDADVVRKILELTPGGNGAGLAYDATGITQTVEICLRSLALNGKAVLIGNLAQKIDFPLQWVVTRQISLFGSCASAGEYNQCLRLIEEGKVDVDALISKAVPLSEGNEWINRVYAREPGLNKIVLLP